MNNDPVDLRQNYAQLILENRFSPYAIPMLLWFVCAETQIYLSEIVNMAMKDGYFIVQLTHGARVVSVLFFGLRGVIALLAVPLLYIFLLSRPTLGTTEGMVITLSSMQTLTVLLIFEVIRKYRKLNISLDGVRLSDVMVLIISSALLSTTIQIFLAPPSGQIAETALFAFSVLSKIVGGLIIYYLCMLVMSQLYDKKI